MNDNEIKYEKVESVVIIIIRIDLQYTYIFYY